MILCSNPLAQYESYKDEIDSAISRVIKSGFYILGEEVKAFEVEFSEYIHAKFATGVGSGTEALHIALLACEIGNGDEVITVSHTAVATVAAIELSGAEPVLADIEPDYFTLDPDKLESLITEKTKAIVPVHIYGQPADLTSILEIANKYNLKVIEDCSQAHGAFYNGQPVGIRGDMGCFSFYPTKNLGAIGDGGIVVTNNEKFAKNIKLLREYGWAERYISYIPGLNSRLDELQAAILRVKLKYLNEDNNKRRILASVYDKELKDTDLILPEQRNNSSHVFHLYVVRSHKRDELYKFLRSKDIGVLIHYPVPIHLQPAYKDRLKGYNSLPETEKASKEVLSLPIFPELSEETIGLVSKTIRDFERGNL